MANNQKKSLKNPAIIEKTPEFSEETDESFSNNDSLEKINIEIRKNPKKLTNY